MLDITALPGTPDSLMDYADKMMTALSTIGVTDAEAVIDPLLPVIEFKVFTNKGDELKVELGKFGGRAEIISKALDIARMMIDKELP